MNYYLLDEEERARARASRAQAGLPARLPASLIARRKRSRLSASSSGSIVNREYERSYGAYRARYIRKFFPFSRYIRHARVCTAVHTKPVHTETVRSDAEQLTSSYDNFHPEIIVASSSSSAVRASKQTYIRSVYHRGKSLSPLSHQTNAAMTLSLPPSSPVPRCMHRVSGKLCGKLPK